MCSPEFVACSESACLAGGDHSGGADRGKGGLPLAGIAQLVLPVLSVSEIFE